MAYRWVSLKNTCPMCGKLEDPAVRAKYIKLAKDVLRKMGFEPEKVEWLK